MKSTNTPLKKEKEKSKKAPVLLYTYIQKKQRKERAKFQVWIECILPMKEYLNMLSS